MTMSIFRNTIATIVIVLSWVFLIGAPAPKKKPIWPLTKADLIGEWNLKFSNGRGTCQLAKDGYYSEQWYGQEWMGTWNYDCKKRRLTITEWIIREDGKFSKPLTWTATLKHGAREGSLCDGSNFALLPVVKKKP